MTNKLNTDSATIIGLWFTTAGFVVSIAGIGLTLYSFYKDKPDVFTLTLSGWLAACLFAIVAILVGNKLVNLAAAQTQRIVELESELIGIRQENQRLISIGDFLASKTMRSATPRKPKAIAEERNEVPNGN